MTTTNFTTYEELIRTAREKRMAIGYKPVSTRYTPSEFEKEIVDGDEHIEPRYFSLFPPDAITDELKEYRDRAIAAHDSWITRLAKEGWQ